MKNTETKIIEKEFNHLIRAELIKFPQMREPLKAPTEQGVYIIYNPKGDIVHVGRSVRGRNGLYQRLRNHLRGNSSFANQFLNGDGSKLRSGYKYKYRVIPDPRTRALLEALATGRLCPKHLGLGEKSQ